MNLKRSSKVIPVNGELAKLRVIQRIIAVAGIRFVSWSLPLIGISAPFADGREFHRGEGRISP